MSSKADDLHHELDRLKQSLRDTDENIRKLTGRELLAENRFRPRENFRGPPAKRPNVGGVGNWAPGRVLGSRVQGGGHNAPDEDGDDDELTHKPTIQSSVVATQKDTKSRQDIIEKQNGSEKDKARNRRMFGVLLGTLQQFRAEEKQHESQEKKRKAVEQKLEEKQKEEKEVLKKEKQQLFIDRREKQIKMKQLENKIELVKLHEDWEEQTRTLMNFIRSDTKPHIFFMPKKDTDASSRKHEQTRAALEAIISERKRQLEEEIDEGNKQDTENKEDEKKQRGDRSNRTLRRYHDDGEKMEVSDLEDDTGINVDYGDSGDDERHADEAKQINEGERSSEKKQKVSHRHSPKRRTKDEKRSGHLHSSKRRERRSESVEESFNTSAELQQTVNDEDEARAATAGSKEAKVDEEENNGIQEEHSGYDITDIPCPTTEPKDSTTDDHNISTSPEHQ